MVKHQKFSKYFDHGCSKVDDIETPLRLLEIFFDDVLVDWIVGYIKLYSHREKADISFEIANENVAYS